ncbi:CARKD family protein [Megaselia abdita]
MIIKLLTQNKRVFCKGMSTLNYDSLQSNFKTIVPALSAGKHKGSAGRIGVIGGSEEYTGAPYFSGISALKLGADLVHVFCHSKAATVIKSYSPDLIVHPLLDKENAVDQITLWLNRLHCLVVGPGLGREENTLRTVTELIVKCKELNMPLIIDADGLFLIAKNPKIIKNHSNVILTPNVMEYRNLFSENPNIYENTDIIVLEKGANDKVHINGQVVEFPEGGSNRRCGGQGDILSGCLATFYSWALEAKVSNPGPISCAAASLLTKTCNKLAFEKHGRSMLASDMIPEIHNVFVKFFEK